MKLGERVIVINAGSNFHGCEGLVVRLGEKLGVHLDGETKPMVFGDREVAPVSDRKHHGGAE